MPVFINSKNKNSDDLLNSDKSLDSVYNLDTMMKINTETVRAIKYVIDNGETIKDEFDIWTRIAAIAYGCRVDCVVGYMRAEAKVTFWPLAYSDGPKKLK